MPLRVHASWRGVLPSVSWLCALCDLCTSREGRVGIVVFGYLEIISDFPQTTGKSTKDSHILPSAQRVTTLAVSYLSLLVTFLNQMRVPFYPEILLCVFPQNKRLDTARYRWGGGTMSLLILTTKQNKMVTVGNKGSRLHFLGVPVAVLNVPH